MIGSTWIKIRLSFFVICFASALFVPAEQSEKFEISSDWMFSVEVIFAILGLMFIPIGLLLVIGLQAANPFSDEKWSPPTHRSNPLHFGNPLLFFHFAAFGIGAQSLGFLTSSLWNGWPVAVLGTFGVLGAIMVLVDVRLCMRVFKDKMMEPAPNQSEID